MADPMGAQLSRAEVEAGLAQVRAAPRERGAVALIVRRTGSGQREILGAAELRGDAGLVGDAWPARRSSRTADGSPHPDMMLTVTSARAIALVAGHPDRWALAGDQLYLDYDLSADHTPPGTSLRVGGALIVVTDIPHRGCAKFAERYGREALAVFNTPEGRALHLRGVHARVLVSGVVRQGDLVEQVSAPVVESRP